jgi:glyoxylase-like metal-dependent hydrolase (beta-lactamase superfamily II)
MQSRFLHSRSSRIRLLATLIAAENQYILVDTGLPGQPAMTDQLNLLGVTPNQIECIEEQSVLPRFLKLWPTPGHTKAHYAVECKGKPKSCLITGDAMPAKLFWKSTLKELVPGYDKEKFRASKKMIESFDGIIIHGIIIPSHDLPFESRSRHTMYATIKAD